MAYMRIDEDVKAQILEAVKNKRKNVYKVAEDYDVSPKTIYSWLRDQPAAVKKMQRELQLLKRENAVLKKLVVDLAKEAGLKKKT